MPQPPVKVILVKISRKIKFSPITEPHLVTLSSPSFPVKIVLLEGSRVNCLEGACSLVGETG